VDPLAHVDPALVGDRFAGPLRDALAHRTQFRELVARAEGEAMRARFDALATKLDDGVLAMWDTAQRATQVERTVATMDVDRITAEYKESVRGGVDEGLARARAERFRAAQQLLNALDSTDERLRLLDARLGAAVTNAATILLVGDSGAVTEELDGVLDELVALRWAVDELA
jgi:hypothetical protein